MLKATISVHLLVLSAQMFNAQVQIDKHIELTGGTGDRMLTNLEAPVNGTDAVNKDYVDNAVAATGGGSGKPEMVSAESGGGMIYSQAVQYCEGLSEGGYTDWRIPTADELTYFSGSNPSANYVWTKTLAAGKENPVNQNYVTMRLSDGKWRAGGEVTGLLLARTVSGSATSTTYTSVATLTPITPGNVIIPTFITFQGSRNSSSPCCQNSQIRLKSNFADGSTAYSSIFNVSTSNTVAVNLSSIPLLTSVTPLTSMEIEIASFATTVTTSANLTVSGYEVTMTQADGAVLKARRVR